MEDLLQRGSQLSLFNSALYSRDLPPAPFLQNSSWSAPFLLSPAMPPQQQQQQQDAAFAGAPMMHAPVNANGVYDPMSSTPFASQAGSPPRRVLDEQPASEAVYYRAGETPLHPSSPFPSPLSLTNL